MVVLGDSHLVISFMRGLFKPKLRELVTLVRRCKEVARKLPYRVIYAHIPREENQWADFLSKVALVSKQDVDMA